ncbi:NMDA receptor-regulated protein 1-domain-containing protein [Suillus fuscotomentosus]|uniref:NMDA receptor-regulated protein 1-domain-containing protein n=1 Tax=Suillus fuscotomentosus TaxID=1912939 RepID=A0AAD4E9Y4_9AGAM|nr:NMDA receptor-regulated protein 1-domain-containing protein [Suillus fuscotomentosus]KAG1902316.1 NMDA receptor-regulated protein 1-domain-containing protein [Suillus fuscotomentosus]
MAPPILAQKDKKLFADLLSQYENRQLSKGRKTADQILKKYPEHGETMCMKGLILVHLGQRDEGINLVKEGMRKDLSSHICWHVWALIQKSEHKYEDALKSYIQALKFDKDNFNILRDTAVLQTQTRQFEGLVETRHNLLRLRPYNRHHWVGLAVAYQLNGNLDEAKQVLEHIEGFLRNIGTSNVEFSELLMYHVRILEDMGDFQSAVDMLESHDRAKGGSVLDRMASTEMKARLLAKLKESDADDEKKTAWTERADAAWRWLLSQNADGYEYYKGFLANQGIDLANVTDENREKALEMLRDYSNVQFATAPRRLALHVATGQEFQDLIKPYLTNGLTKGIPSLFADLKPLYKDSVKRQIIEDIVEELRGTFATSTGDSVQPTTYLWALYLLAQHHSYLGRHKQALEILDIAIVHTPTLPELYMTRARALKRAGDPHGAARAMNDARLLDGQDRFINTKTGKYLLRAGMVNEADTIFSKFTRGGAPAGADLEEMQAMHYLVEQGDSYRRAGKLNLALKKYYVIQKVFESFREDQYEFHQYSVRKTILNVYTEMLKWEDNVRSHPGFIHAAVATVQIWVALYDDATLGPSLQPPETTGSDVSSKKAINKAKKAARKGQPEADGANSKKATAIQPEDRGLEPPRPRDDDPEGLKLVLAEDPLERADKYLTGLSELVPQNMDICFAIYDVAIRRKKYLQAVRMLARAHSLDSEHPGLHSRIAHLRNTVSSLPEPIPVPVGPILAESIASLLPAEVSLELFNSQYLQKHSSSPMAIVAHAKVAQILKAPQDEVDSILFTVLKEPVQLDHEAAFAVLSYLKEMKSPRAEEFRIACNDRFELSTLFRSDEEIAALQKSFTESGESSADGEALETVI